MGKEKGKSRDYLSDNIKAILIFLVVLAHFIGLAGREQSYLLDYIHCVILSFHMPAFLFVSGYLSKYSKDNYSNAFENCLIPYLIMCILVFLLEKALGHKVVFLIVRPPFALWFLLALFMYRVCIGFLIRVRFIIPLCFLLGLLGACSTQFNTTLTLTRFIAFLPYFVVGYFIKPEQIQSLRNKKAVRYGFGIGAFFLIAICAIFLVKAEITRDIFLCRLSYESSGFSNKTGILFRILSYLLGFAGTLGLFLLLPSKATIVSFIGRNSITAYLFHIFLYILLKDWGILREVPYFFLISIIALLVTVLGALPFVVKGYRLGINTIKKWILRE